MPSTVGIVASAVWTPLDLNPALWLDAADTATITESGGFVSQWNDKSGNGRNVTQAVGANQPTTSVATINGRNALIFGASSFMTTTSFTLSQPLTVYAVFRTSSGFATALASRFASVFDGTPANTGTRSIFFLRRNQENQRIALFAGSLQTHDLVLANSTLYAAAAFFDGASSRMRFNAVDRSLAASPGTAGVIAGVRVGGGDAASRLLSDLGEIIVCQAALNASEVTALETYLSVKWGTP